MITAGQLKSIVPLISDNHLNIYVPLLNGTLDKYGINSNERLSCFIAQVAHESGSFIYTKELASGFVYEGRTDLGNVNKGDGIKFKGRGLIQVTGRTNYGLCSKYLYGDERLLDNPSMLEEPVDALNSAYWYWNSHNLNDICDMTDNYVHYWHGRDWNKFQWLTIKINGGLNGYTDRFDFYQRAEKVLNV